MKLQTELQAYSDKINLPLLNSIVAFVLDTAEAARAQRDALYQASPLLYAGAGGSDFQETYGFLYLGELLERYGERFGMAVPDLRAIALALGYTREFATGEMFVGPQRDDFLRKVRAASEGDIYLTGALYLLNEGNGGSTVCEQELTAVEYGAADDLIFALSLFQDRERAFLHFRPQLLRLLGKERTMPMLGNMTAWNWLVTWLLPCLKAARGKDMALLRALCALPTSHVKAGSKHHDVLLAHGYTPLEIAYANMLTVLAQTAEGCLGTNSIVSEKIAVDLFREVLSGGEQLAPETYSQLTQVYKQYDWFKIKCHGHERMEDALKDGVQIRNAATLLWFSGLTGICHPAFSGFDIMDSKWDRLAAVMEPKTYRSLFEGCLNSDMTKDEIRSRLDRYKELTGKDYADIYWDSANGCRFNLLVNKGVLDLWNLFQGSLAEDGSVAREAMISNIGDYVHKISTIQAYQFFERFFSAYGVAGLDTYFGGYRRGRFFEALTEQSRYSRDEHIQLKLSRDCLDEDGHRQLLHWLEEYMFAYQPERYMPFVVAILRDDFTAGLFSAAEQRKLFDLVAAQPNMPMPVVNELKRRYLTEEELRADRDAEAAARQDAERRQQAETVQSIRDNYGELLDGSFSSVLKFLDEYKYYGQKRPIACRIAREGLARLLDAKSYELDSQEAARFLHVCAKLTQHGALRFSEAREYISKIKECIEDDENG